MIRTGHQRALRDRRISALAAAVMLLLALGASLLVSAGSEHHQRGTTAAVVSVGDTPAAQSESHEHHHGNDWTPTLGSRLRPAGDAVVLAVLPARLSGPEPAVRPESAAEPLSTGTELSVLGVLRV